MQIISEKTEFKLEKPSAVAIGKFDGVHAGHYRLLDEILRQKKNGLQSVIFTFYPSAAVYFGGSDVKELTTRREKRQIFEKMGIDVLVEFPLNPETAATEPAAFIKDILIGQMNMKFLAAGEDVSFGKDGKGNRALLEKMAEEENYTVKIIEKIFDRDREISSTYVREEILKGNMEHASQLLLRNYSMEGIVENGMHLGRKMGFPTVNLYPPKDKLMPPYGVYYSLVFYEGCRYHGITNIGMKPTVQQTKVVNAETYLYDFDRDIYGKNIRLELLKFKRPEVKFPDLSALQKQLRQDVTDGREWFLKFDRC